MLKGVQNIIKRGLKVAELDQPTLVFIQQKLT